jgi:tetratricopeptide (TPR) repeat protein
MEKTGIFSPQDFAEILRDVLITEKSGILHFRRAGVWKRIYLFQGMVAAAGSSLEEESLTACLEVSDETRAEIARQSGEIADDPLALGRFLVERDLVPTDRLAAGMNHLTREVLGSLFKWDTGEFEMEEGEIDPEPFAPDVLNSVSFILKGIEGMSEFRQIREILTRIEAGLKWSEAQYLPVECLAFGPLEGFVLSRIDGRTSVRDICALSPPNEEDRTCRFLYGLLVLGIVGWDPPVNGDRFHYQNLAGAMQEEEKREKEETERIMTFYRMVSDNGPFQILGIQETDSLEMGREASRRLREEFFPQNFTTRVRSQRKEELELIDAKILEAYLAFQAIKTNLARKVAGGEAVAEGSVTGAGQRRELSKTETQAQLEQRTHLADQFYQRARESQIMGDFHSAIDFCQNAIRNNPTVAGYFALLAACQLKNPDYRWQKRAEENMQKAIEIDPWAAGNYVTLAQFYIAHGMKKKAKRLLEKALEIQSNHVTALEEFKKLK